MKLSECINFELTSAQNAVHSSFKAQLIPFDVTPVQYALLKCLWDEDMRTPTQLAQMLRLDTSSITGILARLEKKELVERIYSRQDRRSVSVHLLSAGAALQEPIEKAILEANRKVIGDISPEAYAHFLECLHKIEHNAKEQTQSGNAPRTP